MSQVVGEDPADDIRSLESHWRERGALGADDQALLVNSWLLLGNLDRALELTYVAASLLLCCACPARAQVPQCGS